MHSLKDKIAIISGASRGIGFAIAECFAREGAKLVLSAKQNLDALKGFPDARIMKLDLANKKDIDLLVSKTIETFGRIDILVNNASVYKRTDFVQITENELDMILDVDFKGPFLLTQKIFMQMEKQKSGKIINIASGAGIMGSAKASHYASAKAALITLTKSLAKLGGSFNININAVAPGFIETDMIKDMLLDKKEFIESIIPLGRIGKAEDVANLVRFLASESANYITGQTISIDGGHCMI